MCESEIERGDATHSHFRRLCSRMCVLARSEEQPSAWRFAAERCCTAASWPYSHFRRFCSHMCVGPPCVWARCSSALLHRVVVTLFTLPPLRPRMRVV